MISLVDHVVDERAKRCWLDGLSSCWFGIRLRKARARGVSAPSELDRVAEHRQPFEIAARASLGSRASRVTLPLSGARLLLSRCVNLHQASPVLREPCPRSISDFFTGLPGSSHQVTDTVPNVRHISVELAPQFDRSECTRVFCRSHAFGGDFWPPAFGRVRPHLEKNAKPTLLGREPDGPVENQRSRQHKAGDMFFEWRNQRERKRSDRTLGPANTRSRETGGARPVCKPRFRWSWKRAGKTLFALRMTWASGACS